MKAAWANINLSALSHNVQVIRKQAQQRKILAVLKANAYGHGLVRIAQSLEYVDALGVARLDEALEIRNAFVSRPIVLLEGFFESEQLPMLAASNIQPVIHHAWQVEAILQATQLPEPLKVWLKIDTGMHRLGLEPHQAQDCYQRLLASSNVIGAPVLMSHFACADEPNNIKNKDQLDRFHQLYQQLEPTDTSIANSGALFADLGHEYDWVRPGLCLYGVSPFSEATPTIQQRIQQLQTVMTLCADLISTRHVAAGEAVGYGSSWIPKQDTRIGIVSIGYGDGYPHLAPQGTPVWIDGRIYPLVGRVAMDMVTVDLGLDNTFEPGMTAQLWGPDLPVERVAQHVGTIPYELLCNVAKRVHLVYQEA